MRSVSTRPAGMCHHGRSAPSLSLLPMDSCSSPGLKLTFHAVIFRGSLLPPASREIMSTHVLLQPCVSRYSEVMKAVSLVELLLSSGCVFQCDNAQRGLYCVSIGSLSDYRHDYCLVPVKVAWPSHDSKSNESPICICQIRN